MEIRELQTKPIALTNDGTLSCFFLGVGSAFSKAHYQTNLLVIKGSDHLLIDCGTKTPQALFELGMQVTDIRNFLITHSHADHIGGLEEVMLMNRYVARKKPTILINDMYQHILWDDSLRGGSGFNEEEAGKLLGFSDLWNIVRPKWLVGYPRETFEGNIGSINLKIFRTIHIPDTSLEWETAFWSSGVILDNRVMFTSDTKFDKALIEEYDKKFDFEIIFHDCQFYQGGVHASLDELNSFPAKLKKKMVLMHYGDNWKQFETKVKDYGFIDLAKQWCFYDFKKK
jgi:L-ascorbate metabolism protein UlaG (beta-lactamase superfamily)